MPTRHGGSWAKSFSIRPLVSRWRITATLSASTRVGWSMRDHMRTELPLAALMMAAQLQRPTEGLICHSDRGSQHASEAYGKQLLAMKAKPSRLALPREAA